LGNLGLSERRARFFKKPFACLGQRDGALLPARKKLCAEHSLEGLNLMAQRGRRNIEFFGGAREMQFFGDRDEIPKMPQFDGPKYPCPGELQARGRKTVDRIGARVPVMDAGKQICFEVCRLSQKENRGADNEARACSRYRACGDDNLRGRAAFPTMAILYWQSRN